MKRLTRIISGWVAALALVTGATSAFAQTLLISYVNFPDSTFTTPIGLEGVTPDGANLNAIVIASSTIYRGGKFTTVGTQYIDQNNNPVIELRVNGQHYPSDTLWTFAYADNIPYPNGVAANNVFRLDWNLGTARFNFLVLDIGYYRPPGNGVNGTVFTMGRSNVGDLYVGGAFSEAGGFPYSANIGVYRASGGWQSHYIWSAVQAVTSMTWDANNRLVAVTK